MREAGLARPASLLGSLARPASRLPCPPSLLSALCALRGPVPAWSAGGAAPPALRAALCARARLSALCALRQEADN
eukprot:21282-Heterocapsa_arctica.AAC.1